MKNRIIYGIKRLYFDIKGKEDYWHPRLKARICKLDDYRFKYYLDFSSKGIYPFELNNGIPIVEMNGEKRFFSITIFNYGIGLIDLYTKSDTLKNSLNAIINWTILNQEKDGAWRNYYDVPFFSLKSGWSSAMGQGLGISFIYRCYNLNLIEKHKAINIIERAINHLLTEDLNISTKYGKILQEFGGTKENVLNGFIFAIYGIRDYCCIINDYTLYNQYINSLVKILKEYNMFLGWSYYTTTKIISSSFYHRLHIDMMNSLHHLTKDNFFLVSKQNWEKGYKLRFLFTLVKATQKLIKFNSINTLNTMSKKT